VRLSSPSRSVLAVISGAFVLLTVAVSLGYLFSLLAVHLGSGPTSGLSELLIAVTIGLLAQIPAGYVVARFAPSWPYLHAIALVVAFSIAAGLLISTGAGPVDGGLETAAVNLIQLPGILLGVWIHERRTPSEA